MKLSHKKKSWLITLAVFASLNLLPLIIQFMKNLLFIFLLFISFNLSAQTKLEDIIKSDSAFQSRYNIITEGCIKTQVRLKDKTLNCPTFIDEEGYFFYICIINQHLEYITLDTNVSID